MVKVTIEGAKKTKKFLIKKNVKTNLLINQAMTKAGAFMESEVKQSIAGHRAEPTSVDTGRFLNSVTTDNSKTMQSTVESKVKYAKFLEFGSSRISARHHFKNSGKRNEVKMGQNIFVKNSNYNYEDLLEDEYDRLFIIKREKEIEVGEK